jgi:hypothetical protein
MPKEAVDLPHVLHVTLHVEPCARNYERSSIEFPRASGGLDRNRIDREKSGATFGHYHSQPCRSLCTEEVANSPIENWPMFP